MNTLQPIVGNTSAITDRLVQLLSRFQVWVAIVLIVPEAAILMGVLELAAGVEPLDTVKLILLLQAMLFASDKLDNIAVVQAVIALAQKIDFKDDRIDDLVDAIDDIVPDEQVPPAATVLNQWIDKGVTATELPLRPEAQNDPTASTPQFPKGG